MRKALILIVLLCFALRTEAQVPVALSPLAKQQFLSITGIPLASGCVYTYITGTSTPLATYTDGTGTATNPNPIILDSGGFGNIWLKNASYRFTLYSRGTGGVQGTDCYSGSFQYTVDQVSAYTVINQVQNIFLLGQTSDPAGSAGELIYRSDIPCFRGFTTLWDCFVMLTATQTETNKTFVSPVINGAVTGTGIQGADSKLLTSGTVAGTGVPLCTDASGGATTTGCSVFPAIVYKTASISTGSLGPISMFTSPSNEIYRFSVYVTQTALGTACTSNSTIAISLTWKDPNEAGVSSTIFFTVTPSAANNGALGRMVLTAVPAATQIPYGGEIQAASGSIISFSTVYTPGATCAPPPQYQIFPILEQLN